MADESLLPGNLDLSSIPDAPRPQPLLAGLDQSSTPDAPKPDENQGCITQSDPLSSCIINLRKSIFPPMSPEQAAAYMTESDPLSSRILELKKSIFASGPPELPKPETVPYAGEDQGSQLSSYNPDSWISGKIPAPAQPLFASVPRPPERLYRENAPKILQDIWNAASPEPIVGPLREHPLPPDQRGLTLADPPTAAANDTNYLGSSPNNQAAVLGEQGSPRINMLNIYKQWAIGGIDTLLRVLYEASGALDIAIPYEPYQSPFSAPADVNDQTARLMGSFQLPALIGPAADDAGPFGGIPETTESVAARGGVDLALKYKPGWTAEQMAEADAKVEILNNSETVVTQVERSGTSAAIRYRQSEGIVPSGNDVDHMVDLQLGGADILSNMWPLDSSVNRSLGAQIQRQIKDLPTGTRINRVKIGE
jgi:hypothetical protein